MAKEGIPAAGLIAAAYVLKYPVALITLADAFKGYLH
jgi:hypothetical protein